MTDAQLYSVGERCEKKERGENCEKGFSRDGMLEVDWRTEAIGCIDICCISCIFLKCTCFAEKKICKKNEAQNCLNLRII